MAAVDPECPIVLVIDDVLGWDSLARDGFCEKLGLTDVTTHFARQPWLSRSSFLRGSVGPASVEPAPAKVQAVFHSGQERDGEGRVVNQMDRVLAAVEHGWRWQFRWSLILLDIVFIQGGLRQRNDGSFVGGDLDDPHSDERFGVRILEKLAREPRFFLRDGRTALPVITISTTRHSEIERELNGLGNAGYINRRFLGREQNWEQQATAFREGLFVHGLVPDIPLPDPAVGANQAVPRKDPERRKIIGRSLPLLRALRVARRVARINRPCLIQGPSGSGKELLGRYVHDCSERRGGFVPVNCSAIPLELAESELFGHVKGAFTGAVREKPGYIRGADKGTLFLDEIGEMAPSIQPKLLRFFESNTIQRVGSGKEEAVDVRVVGATNLDLGELVREKRFRGDLLSRLEVAVIDVPSLNQRKEDVELLFRQFLNQSFEDLGSPKRVATGVSPHSDELVDIDPSVFDSLRSRNWKGNVRDLVNEAFYVSSICGITNCIVEAHLREPGGSQSGLEGLKARLSDALSQSTAPQPPTLKAIKGLVCEIYLEWFGTKTEASKILGVDTRTLDKCLRLGEKSRGGDSGRSEA